MDVGPTPELRRAQLEGEWAHPDDEVDPRTLDRMNRRSRSGGIDEDTREVSWGPLTISVELARTLGWSPAQIVEVAALIGTVSRKHTRVAAWRQGKRFKCPSCEQWNEASDDPERCKQCVDEHATYDERHPHGVCDQCGVDLDPADTILGRWCSPECADLAEPRPEPTDEDLGRA